MALIIKFRTHVSVGTSVGTIDEHRTDNSYEMFFFSQQTIKLEIASLSHAVRHLYLTITHNQMNDLIENINNNE